MACSNDVLSAKLALAEALIRVPEVSLSPSEIEILEILGQDEDVRDHVDDLTRLLD